jgi:hypothetical protein
MGVDGLGVEGFVKDEEGNVNDGDVEFFRAEDPNDAAVPAPEVVVLLLVVLLFWLKKLTVLVPQVTMMIDNRCGDNSESIKDIYQSFQQEYNFLWFLDAIVVIWK